MKRRNRIPLLSVLLLLLLLSGSVTASANAGPPHSIEDGDAEFLIPVKESDIAVLSENLSYRFGEPVENTLAADITASYEMHNTGSESATVQAAFVSNNPELPVSLVFGGEPVAVIRQERITWEEYEKEPRGISNPIARDWDNLGIWKHFGVWEPTFREIMFYFSTGERSADFDPSGNYHLEVTLFEMRFEPGETVTLAASYTENCAFITDSSGYKTGLDPRFESFYFLEPAQYWKDFKDLSVTVAVPEGLRAEFSLEGFTEAEGMHTAFFETLPQENLQILLYIPQPFVLHPDDLVPFVLVGLAVIAVLILTVMAIRRIRRKK